MGAGGVVAPPAGRLVEGQPEDLAAEFEDEQFLGGGVEDHVHGSDEAGGGDDGFAGVEAEQAAGRGGGSALVGAEFEDEELRGAVGAFPPEDVGDRGEAVDERGADAGFGVESHNAGVAGDEGETCQETYQEFVAIDANAGGNRVQDGCADGGGIFDGTETADALPAAGGGIDAGDTVLGGVVDVEGFAVFDDDDAPYVGEAVDGVAVGFGDGEAGEERGLGGGAGAIVEIEGGAIGEEALLGGGEFEGTVDGVDLDGEAEFKDGGEEGGGGAGWVGDGGSGGGAAAFGIAGAEGDVEGAAVQGHGGGPAATGEGDLGPGGQPFDETAAGAATGDKRDATGIDSHAGFGDEEIPAWGEEEFVWSL